MIIQPTEQDINPDLVKFKNEWKPNPQQEEFLRIPFSIKEALYGGGAGSGKSDVLLVYGILNRWHENPLFKQVFLRRTYPELKNEILGRAREIYSKFGATFNKSDMIWTFPRPDQYGSGGMQGNAGAQIFLGHCENEDDVHKYDSMQISLFTPDEITSLTEWIYLYISQERNRSPKHSNLPSITRAAGMPGGIGHTFVKKRFVDPAPAGGKIIIGKGGNKRIYIHATLEDNKEHIDPTYAQSLDGRPEAERKAKKFGDWSAYLGQVFDEFRDRKYPDEPDNALHVVTPFDIPKWWPRFIIGDWGYAAMCWVGFFAVSPDKRLYLYRERYWIKTKIAIWAPEIKDFIDDEKPRVVKFCKSAGQERGQEHTIQSEIENHLGVSIELTTNSPGSRIAGKMMMHEYLRWHQKPQPKPGEIPEYNEAFAQRLLRNRGEIEYRSYIASFEPHTPETNIPKYQIFRCEAQTHEGHDLCCPTAIEAIKACNYAESKNDKPAEDVKEFNGDDPYDGQRYAIDTAESFFVDASDEFEKIQKQDDLLRKLQQSGDWTAFYRNSRTLESSDKVQMVRMFHRRAR